jgi:hypothetical protein
VRDGGRDLDTQQTRDTQQEAEKSGRETSPYESFGIPITGAKTNEKFAV